MNAFGNWVVDDLLDPRPPKLYRCHHSATEELSAVVEVIPDNAATRDMHRRAIDALKGLGHENIPDLIDFGLDPESGTLWRAYRTHVGERLSDKLTAGRLDWRDVCGIFHQIGLAMEHVHNAGFAHRDMHPGRIVVANDGTAWLTGFDFALTADQLERMAHMPVGNMSYLAPEVIAEPAFHGPRADLYALGVVLFEALTGTSAFPAAAWGERADAATRMLEWKTRTAALDPSKHVDVPAWLTQLVRKATDPDPDKRLPDIEAFNGWLEAAAPAWRTEVLKGPGANREAATAPPSLATPAPTLSMPPTRLDMPSFVPAAANNNAGMSAELAQLVTVAAAILGVVTGMAFSSLVVMFVELSLRV